MDSIQTFFLFIQDQILGMKWLNSLIKNLLTALNVDVDGRLGGSIQFFYLRRIENNNPLMLFNFYYLLYTKLFST